MYFGKPPTNTYVKLLGIESVSFWFWLYGYKA